MAIYKLRNLEAMSFYSLIEGIIILMIYSREIKSVLWNKMTVILLPFYVIIYCLVYYYIDFNKYLSFNAYAFQHFILLICVVFYFFERMKLLDDLFITRNPMFWVSSGFLIFYSISIFYFGLVSDIFQVNKAVAVNGWWIHSTGLLIMNILLTKAVWQIPTE